MHFAPLVLKKKKSEDNNFEKIFFELIFELFLLSLLGQSLFMVPSKQGQNNISI